jgi:hypothetical protein
MLKTFDMCPKKFEFKYVKGISMPVNDEIFETGKNIHALASYYLRNENIDNMESSLNANEVELWKYLKNIKYFSYDYINSEYNLAVKIGEHFFGGRLDALMKNSSKYYILDYKTGGAPKNYKYDFQTIVYLLAVSEFFKTNNVEFVYIDLRNKCEVSIELNDLLVKEYKEKLLTIANLIDKNEFETKEKNCPCEYNLICYR